MNRQAFWGVTAVLLLMVLSAVSVSAQPILKAKIPFEFYVGDMAIPPGDNAIERSSVAPHIYELKNAQGKGVTYFSTIPMETRGKGRANELRFNRYDNRHFLSSIWRDDNPVGRKLEVSRHERELRASSGKPVLRVLIASAH